jgi:phosphoadenosine phosphosulfate reductase
MTAASPLVTAQPDRFAAIADRLGALEGEALLRRAIRHEFSGRIALVSSFGIEAAVLLHMVAQIDPSTPVVFLETGKLFGETLRYRDQLIRKLGLTDVRSIMPDPARVQTEDPGGALWQTNPDRCCMIRKVEPLAKALDGFDAWINGRKRSHGGLRATLPSVEVADGKIKLNPLADFGSDEIAAYFATQDLPHHPLEEDGFRSIGCMPCSDRTAAGEDPRAGRWRGNAKTECGIHLSSSSSSSSLSTRDE